MARARKAKPPDTRMAFDFGDAPVAVKIGDPPAPEPATVPEPPAEIRSEAGSGGAGPDSNPGACAADEAPPTVATDDTRPISIEMDHAHDCVCESCVALRSVANVDPRGAAIDVAPTPGAAAQDTTDMSERASKSSKNLDPNLRKLMAADEIGRREGEIIGLAGAAEIALVRGHSREIYDMIVTDLRRRFRGHADRVDYHLRLRGVLAPP